MESKILMTEVVENKERKFGADLKYFPARLELASGKVINCLFTVEQLQVAVERAENNPEDVPEESFWESLFG